MSLHEDLLLLQHGKIDIECGVRLCKNVLDITQDGRKVAESTEIPTTSPIYMCTDDCALNWLENILAFFCVWTVSMQEQQNNLSAAIKTETSVNSKPNIWSLIPSESQLARRICSRLLKKKKMAAERSIFTLT